jgi:hypothetical protein
MEKKERVFVCFYVFYGELCVFLRVALRVLTVSGGVRRQSDCEFFLGSAPR